MEKIGEVLLPPLSSASVTLVVSLQDSVTMMFRLICVCPGRCFLDHEEEEKLQETQNFIARLKKCFNRDSDLKPYVKAGVSVSFDC